ncbi:MAG: AraC family transcriptional regulator [Pseudomonadota bacterium]
MDMPIDFRIARGMGSVTLLVTMAGEEGLDTADVLAGSGISPADLGDPKAEIDGSQELKVVENLLRLGIDPSFAFRAGMRYRISTFGILGYALMNSDTVRDAVQLCARFVKLTYSFSNIRIEEYGNEARAIFECSLPTAELRAFAVERDMAALAMVSRDMTGKRMPVRQWYMAHEQQAALPVYQRLVDGTPEFGKPANVWIFARSQLDTRLPLANPMTREECVRSCEDLLERRVSLTGIQGRVRDYLLRNAERMPTLEDVAAQFHLTPRTLRRRLADEALCFRDLIESVRREQAEALLRDGRLPVPHIASRLGYRDVSSFMTAFKRWTGTTPGNFRRSA